MNHDTPDAVPSDDLPFLGPAISPRRPVSGSPLNDSDDLAAPFVGGAYDPFAARPAPEAEPIADASAGSPPDEATWSGANADEEVWPREEEVAAEAAALDPFPGSDWPSDDFPWLSPTAPEPEDEGEAEAWRPAVDAGELATPTQEYSVDEQASVQHLSWIGEPISQGEIDAAEAAASESAAEAAEVLDVASFAPEGVEEERAGFHVDAESAEGSWTGEAEWAGAGERQGGEAWDEEVAMQETAGIGAEAQAEGEPGAAELGAMEVSAEELAWDEPEVVASAGPFETGEVEAQVVDGGGAVPEVELEGEEEAALFGEAVEGGPEREAVEAAPLPVGEWEASAAATEVEEEVLESTTLAGEPVAAVAEGDPMEEVAQRLERIAGALRSGRSLEAVEQGDPLQLLITGYALGYAQARRSGR